MADRSDDDAVGASGFFDIEFSKSIAEIRDEVDALIVQRHQ